MVLLPKLIGLVLIALVNGDLCPITLQPAEVVVEHGASASANCSTSITHNGMGWEASQGPVDMQPDVQLITWSVERLEEWDITPFCFINRRVDGQCRVDLKVTVYKTPDNVFISTVGHDGPMVEGGQYKLWCDVQKVAPVQFLTMKWYKGETLVGNTTFTDSSLTPVDTSATLQISPSRDDDGAQYRCEAELDLGPEGPQPPPTVASDPLSITVHYGPVITCSNWSPVVNTILGSYPFPVVGNPRPKLTWVHKRVKVDPTKRLSKYDSGQYQYIATNAISFTSCLINITVEYRCPITLQPAEVVVEHGASASANCSTSITHYGMGWEASQGPVDMQPDVQLITWSVEKLEEWGITPFCFINVDSGQCKVDLKVTVYKTPDNVFISTVGHTGPMVEGGQYELQCDVWKVAPVELLTVKWYKGETLVGNTTFTNSTLTPVDKSATLQISPSRDDDGAQYRCEAELDLGPEGPQPPPTVASDPLSITVHYGPVITCSNWSPVVNTILGSYPFPVVGNPRPKLTWVHKRVKVDPTKRLSKYDSGQYQYIATNAISFTSCLINITVEYGPEIVSVEDSVEVNRAMDASLHCKAEGNPQPEVRWSFNEQVKATGRGEATLTISTAKLADGGVYTCTAENKIGKQTRKVPLVINDVITTEQSLGQDGAMELLLKLIGLVLITLVNGDPDCPITLQPAEVVVEHGASTSANCSTSITHYGMGWEASQGPVDMQPDVQLITWSVERLEEWDITPYCFINVDSDQCKAHLKVTVYKTPDSVSISTVGHTGPMVEGGQYELQCDVQDVAPVELLTVKWYKGETLVGNTTFTNSTLTPVDTSATLQISPSRGDDGAQYRCEAELDLGPEGPQPPPTVVSDPLSITVHYGPVINCSNWSPVVNTTLGSYPFPVVGNPRPKLTWVHKRVKVDPTKRLSKYDSGQYQYMAINAISFTSCLINITVEYGPEIVSVEDSVEVNRAMDASLHCKAEGNPQPEVRWSFNAQAKATGRGEATLTISTAKLADGGIYTCTANNKNGNQTRKVPLVVNDVCPVTLQPAEVVVEHGASASANCSTSITHIGMGWEASQEPVDMRDDVQSITWSVERLEEWGITPFCFINLKGDNQCNVSLLVTVYKIPDSVSISTGGRTSPMVEGRQYELQCDVQDVAPVELLTVKWYKGETLVGNTTFTNSTLTPVDTSATLQISPSRDDDGAQYRCEAELDLGPEGPLTPPTVMSDPFSINVQYKPVIICSHWSTIMNTLLSSYPFPAVGNPAPLVSWSKRGSLVESTKLLSKDDTGQYQYFASNAVGNASCVINITVEYGPEILSGEDSVVVNKTMNAFLHCKAEGNPAPDVRWSFNNQTKATGRGETTLTILRAGLADSGEYICTAANKIGEKIRSVSLKVNDFCPITLQPAEVVVEHGASASANCSTSITHNGMGWEASQGPVDMQPDVQSITWSVERLEEWDITPYCFINVDSGQCKVDLKVTVYKTPDNVFISTVGHTGPMVEGGHYELWCDVLHVAPVQLLTVKWYKGETLVNKTTFTGFTLTPVDKSATLQISPSRDDDGAQYRCEAELDLGPKGPQPPPAVASDSLSIIVHYKPAITCSNWSPVVNTILGSNPFAVVGNPRPKLTWYHKGVEVSSTKRLSKYDSGQYSYNATSSIGNTSCVTNIRVEYGPTFDCPKIYEEEEQERKSHFLYTCNAVACPVANVSWYKGGVKVQPPRNLTRKDNGLYTIKAQNIHGIESHNLIINILYGPEIVLTNESVRVSKGQHVSLVCQAVGNPVPIVSWNFKEQQLTSNRSQTTLNISEATSANGGVYTCSATNKVGKQTRNVEVVVNVSGDYIIQIISIIIIVVLIILLLLCLFVCLRRKRSGKYNVQSNGGGVQMKLLT
ncbi:hemicentin-1 [Salminus brasiliensis]|uniref:hemicentin-1 n=1 Tax=Salminus brasiliensis TaxID=930266 RepID=UPI003B837C06